MLFLLLLRKNYIKQPAQDCAQCAQGNPKIDRVCFQRFVKTSILNRE